MTPFADLSDLPRQLQRPHVRDLAWAILSPPLLDDPPCPQRHPLAASAWAADPQRLAHWLRALDRDEHALRDWLARLTSRRLGLYYESLWQFALSHAPGVELLAANLAIREGGHTLGELDILLRDCQGVHHLELAIKLYLGPPGGDGHDPAHWLGPGCHDRLDLKLAHLLGHQLPISARPQSRAILATLGVSEVQAHLWLGGICSTQALGMRSHRQAPMPSICAGAGCIGGIGWLIARAWRTAVGSPWPGMNGWHRRASSSQRAGQPSVLIAGWPSSMALLRRSCWSGWSKVRMALGRRWSGCFWWLTVGRTCLIEGVEWTGLIAGQARSYKELSGRSTRHPSTGCQDASATGSACGQCACGSAGQSTLPLPSTTCSAPHGSRLVSNTTLPSRRYSARKLCTASSPLPCT